MSCADVCANGSVPVTSSRTEFSRWMSACGSSASNLEPTVRILPPRKSKLCQAGVKGTAALFPAASTITAEAMGVFLQKLLRLLLLDRLLPACICGGGWHSPGSRCRPLIHESKNITACLLHSCAVSWGLTALPAHPDLGKTSMTFPHHAVPGALLCMSAQVLLSSSMSVLLSGPPG
ncbi:uncharacterized protein LOC144116330 [Amblyomma americanum]